jgi:hypothetical protein
MPTLGGPFKFMNIDIRLAHMWTSREKHKKEKVSYMWKRDSDVHVDARIDIVEGFFRRPAPGI